MRLALPCLALLLLAPAARAEMGEWQLALGGDYRALVLTADPDDLTIHAPGVDAGLWYGLDDYWQLGGTVELGVGLPPAGDPGFVGAAALEVRYVLDIVEWVPHLSAAIGALFVSDGADVELVVGVGGGLDYRWSRDNSIGVDLRYDFALTALDDVSATFHAALVFSSHFE